MYPNYLKYSSNDLHKKFKKIIQTNYMISVKSNNPAPIPTDKNLKNPIDLYTSVIESRDEKSRISLFSDMKNVSTGDLSIIMSTPKDNIISMIKSPFKNGVEIFGNAQNLMVFKKKGDEFYAYKMKIYDVR